MPVQRKVYTKILIRITSLVLVFHTLILVGIIPYEITWGGNLKTAAEMYVLESSSILINAFFIYVLLQKENFVKVIFSRRAISIILWVFFALFVLNTVGNLMARTTFEKAFTLLTLLNAFLLWKINTTKTTYQ